MGSAVWGRVAAVLVRVCGPVELDDRRCRRWQHRREAGRLHDSAAGGAAVHAITPFEGPPHPHRLPSLQQSKLAMNTPAQCGVIKPPKADIYSEAPHSKPGKDPVPRSPVGQHRHQGSPTVHHRANTGGFTLTSIGVYFTVIGDTSTADDHLTVTPNANNNGSPGDALCTLGNAASFSTNAVRPF